MSIDFLLMYSLTIFIASILPGPSMLLALTHGMKYGAKKTIASACGNLLVTLLQAAVSIAGLGAILLASESLFTVIKWIGAAYLIYMGVGLMRSPDMKVAGNPAHLHLPGDPPRKLFLQSLFVTAGNPKAIVFFAAVFPQFIDPNAAFAPQFLILMGTGGIIAFGCFMLYAISGQKIVALFSQASIGRAINRIIGGSFIAAGFGLAVSKN